jgi:hypothetical protein
MGSVEWRRGFSGDPGLAMRIGGKGAGGRVGVVGGPGGRRVVRNPCGVVVVSVAGRSGLPGGRAAGLGEEADEDVSSRTSVA